MPLFIHYKESTILFVLLLRIIRDIITSQNDFGLYKDIFIETLKQIRSRCKVFKKEWAENFYAEFNCEEFDWEKITCYKIIRNH